MVEWADLCAITIESLARKASVTAATYLVCPSGSRAQ